MDKGRVEVKVLKMKAFGGGRYLAKVECGCGETFEWSFKIPYNPEAPPPITKCPYCGSTMIYEETYTQNVKVEKVE